MAKVLAAAIYARISADQDGQGLGVTRQLEDCRRLAADRGWVVADEYVDNDISAYSGKRRPAYQRMLEDLREGNRDAVIVYNLDRLTRRPMELEHFLELCDQVAMRNVATVTADIDLGNDDGLFMARVFAAFAAKESGRRSARVRRKMLQVAESGMPHGGSNRPFGYAEDRMTVVESEAAVIRDLATRFIAGESLRSLATWLDESGIKTVRGHPWRTPTIRGMLCSGRIAGLREMNGQIVTTAQWAPIISLRQREQIHAVLAAKKNSGRRAPRSYLLTGLLRCGKCNNTLFSSRRETTRRYVCLSGPDHGGCGRLTVVAAPVEELIADAVLYRLDSPAVIDAMHGKSSADERVQVLTGELARDTERLDELAVMFGTEQITRREWMSARNPIEARIRSARTQIAQASGNHALIGLAGAGHELRGQWAGLNLDRQAAIVRALLDHAVIAPGTPGSRSLDPARVAPVWRV